MSDSKFQGKRYICLARASHSTEEIPPSGAKVGERAGDKLAESVGYGADRSDKAESNLRLTG